MGTALVLCLSAFTSTAPAAGETDIQALKQQLEALQLRVQKLEEVMREDVPVNKASTRTQPVPGGWRKKANWRLLVVGMSDYEVSEILGEPDRERKVKKFEFWEYGSGKVSMYMHRVKSWKVPSSISEK